MAMDYAARTAAELARALRSGRIDAVEIAEWTLDAAAQCGDQAIFTELTPERARKEARAARKRLRAGSPNSMLDGLPVAWKDLFDLKGRVTTAGSLVLKSEAPAKQDAAIIATGAKAGLVSIGCTNMTEFAYSAIGYNPHYGTPWNPSDPDVLRSPGGSSSGSAVAVARGLVAIAFGSDTGGSVRIPAAFTGITGYKSSTGRYSMAGVFPLSVTLDSLGPLTRSVEDCILADAVTRGLVKPAIRKRSLKGLELAVPGNVVLDDCDGAVIDNFEAALGRLRRQGVRIRRIAIPAFDEIPSLIARHGHLLGAEAYALHRARVTGPDAARMDPRVAGRILLAEKMSAYDLVSVQQARRRLITETDQLVGDAIVVFPTVPITAPAIEPLVRDLSEFLKTNLRALRNTMLGNFLDWCGVSVPSGADKEGLPTGFLFNARHNRDADVLSVAWSCERAVRGDA